MKKIVTIAVAMLFVFAVGVVLADTLEPITWESKDTGTLMYLEEVAPGHSHPKRFVGDLLYRPEDVISPTAKKDYSTLIPIEQDLRVDSGTALYNDEFVVKPMLAEKSAEGVAAGGMVREDENTRIWDNLLAPKDLIE
jgi:hypothetical protein